MTSAWPGLWRPQLLLWMPSLETRLNIEAQIFQSSRCYHHFGTKQLMRQSMLVYMFWACSESCSSTSRFYLAKVPNTCSNFELIDGFIQWQAEVIQSGMCWETAKFSPFIFYAVHVKNVQLTQPKVGRKCKHLPRTSTRAPSLAASPKGRVTLRKTHWNCWRAPRRPPLSPRPPNEN